LKENVEKELEERRERLFAHYREVCGICELKDETTGEVKKVYFEDYKRDNHHLPLSSIIPKQMVFFKHSLPLRILAFSDYRVHDFKPLLDYVSNLKEKPDLIIYAGDDVKRFSPMPLEHLRSLLLRLLPDAQYISEAEAKTLLSKENSWFLSEEIDGHRLILRFPRYKCGEDYTLRWSAEVTNTLCYIIDMMSKYHSEKISNDQADISWDLAIIEDEQHVYFCITIDQLGENIFEKLASHAKYGLAAIIGNDDKEMFRAWIHGEKVYELFSSLVKIGPVLFVGLEGSTCGMGPSGMYLESDYKLRLEFVQRLVAEDELIVVVSHTPPKGVLDRAIRYGEESIGSLALRDFVEEEPRVCLIICGHVHSCGGRFETLNNATIVNISSHDDPFSRANIAWITIDEEGKVHVDIRNLPSLIEHIITEDGPDVEEKLKDRCNLSNVEAQLFVSYAKKYKDLFEDLPKLATIKFRYGLPWKLMLMMYERGVKDATQLNEKVFHDIYPYIPGIYRVHWERSYAKFMREKFNEVYLMHPLPITRNDKVIVFDTEYNPEKGVLYGFLDLSCGEVQHFWFDEKDKASKYVQLKMKENYIFVHWGGKDKKLLLDELGVNPQTFNLLYFCQTSLVAPIDSTTLKDVHDALCGHVEDGWWKRNFYDIDGIYKLVLCNRILGDPTDTSSRNSLLEANKADIIALRKVLEALFNLPVKSRTEIK
jgi:Icc-related predicted phosphoesterase